MECMEVDSMWKDVGCVDGFVWGGVCVRRCGVCGGCLCGINAVSGDVGYVEVFV